MFSKAKRFDTIVHSKNMNAFKKQENEKVTQAEKKPECNRTCGVPRTPLTKSTTAGSKKTIDSHSQCSSVKSFVTPKPIKTVTKAPSSLRKPISCSKPKKDAKAQEEIIKAQDVEIRNKDHTIIEYNKQIEELKNEISNLNLQIQKYKNENKNEKDLQEIDTGISQISLTECTEIDNNIDSLKLKIAELELQCERLEQEACGKQVELSSLEELITIRDSLCKDLQNKLTDTEKTLEETIQRLDMVKGHHALALEANESIRREYKVELETLKTKLEEEKQMIISKSKAEQDLIKAKYNTLIETIKDQMLKEKYDMVQELEQQLITKDQEMKAKLEQINEATHEKLRLCEIQFEERTKAMEDHCIQQKKKIQLLEQEIKELQYSINLVEERNAQLQKELNHIKHENQALVAEKSRFDQEINNLKEEAKQKLIDFENEKNKLTFEVDKAIKDKQKFEMSLSVTRDIVQVLTMRLRESDNELEHLEDQLQAVTNSKEELEKELASYKNTLNNSVMECNEYKEALVNILKSKAALAKEHNRIMEHNVTLIESLQTVEKEAYRELGSIKNELIEDVEFIKMESNSQIQMLRDEVEKKRMLCELATEHAGQATAAAEQSRVLLAEADAEITRLENENKRFQQEMQDQQSLVVELSLLRQENEELTMTVAKQSSIIDKLKKEIEQLQTKPKSPSLIRKAHKIGKENMQVSPLRERNQLVN